MTHIKLFIPGPVEVSEKTMRAFSRPMIGHRSKDFQALNADIQPKLQQIFYTKQPVFVSGDSIGATRSRPNAAPCTPRSQVALGNALVGDNFVVLLLRGATKE